MGGVSTDVMPMPCRAVTHRPTPVMQRGQMASRGGFMSKPEVVGMLLKVSDRCMCVHVYKRI